MRFATGFIRILFFSLSILFMMTYTLIGGKDALADSLKGLGLGVLLGSLLLGFEFLFRRFNLRAFNIAALGLFVGYLMGQALVIILKAILDISSASIHLSPEVLEMLQIALFLFGIYLGTLLTIRSSDELYISIPFVRLQPTSHKKKDFLVDGSLLSDARILDIATSGVFDHALIIPRFVIKELYLQSESQEEFAKGKAKKSLDVVKRLEALPHLELRYSDTDFPESSDPMGKLVRLARLLDANILTADISKVQMAAIEGVKIINLHNLSNALKPLMQAGEHIKIKVQRYGKEPRQGVGYLDDGTMVVINGGGEYIGETIDALVLSVKHTTSGRMIFCNAPDEEGKYPQGDDEH